jgi:hypothetical protein
LELDLIAAHPHPAKLEVDADGREQVLVVFAVYELTEKRGLAFVS